MNHTERLIPGENPYETGERSSYMTYGAIEELLRGQAKGFTDQSIKDEEKKLKDLTTDGRNLAKKLSEAADIAAKMWRYSKSRTNTK